jgi:hypothetical protein
MRMYAMHECNMYGQTNGFSSLGCQKLASLSAHGFILKFWVTIIGRCEGQDDMGGYLHPHLELETLKVYMYVHDGSSQRRDGLLHY